MKKYDVFISSKSEDYSLAEKICDFLTSNGLSVFIASRELQRIGIAQYAKAIDEILDNSVHMIVVASSLKNIQSKWVEYEWSLFSNDLKSGYRNGNLMTILSDDVELKTLPGSLRHQQSFNINSYQNYILGYLKIDKAETTDLDDINPGQETICLPNGDKYIGQVKDGKANGRGTLYFANGDRYEGEFIDRLFNGKGTLYYANGARYEGEFKDGHFNGRGTVYFADGGRYEGEFKDGHFNGRGTLYFANGDRHEGEFKDGKAHGRATVYFADGARYEGEYKDGKAHGRGTVYFPSGAVRYEGEFKDGHFNGRGTYYSADGGRYEGEFKDGHFNGRGTLYNADGVFQCLYDNGKIINKINRVLLDRLSNRKQ